MGGWVGDITCLFFVPMSTIFMREQAARGALIGCAHPTSFMREQAARGRCARLQPSGGAQRWVGDITWFFL